MFDALRDTGFDVLAKNHAEAILDRDFADEIRELIDALVGVSIPVAELIASGGGEAASTQRLRRILADSGWRKHNFRIETTVDGQPQGDGTSHEIDHIRRSPNGVLALEIEWNNKDPFFDRDLENFQRLHAQSVISAGIIVTRGSALQSSLRDLVRTFLVTAGVTEESELYRFRMKERTARQRETVRRAVETGAPFADAFAAQFVADKFGTATTHWEKLAARVARGVGNPSPLLLVGLPVSAVTPYSAATPEL